MEGALAFDANSYHQFPNCHEMESDYMRFLTHGKATPAATGAAAPVIFNFLVYEYL